MSIPHTISGTAFRSVRALAAFVFFLFLQTALSAQNAPWENTLFTASPQELQAAAQSFKAKDAEHVSLLFQEEQITYSDQGAQVARSRLVYQVLDDQGVRTWSDLQVSFSPWHQDRPRIKVRVSNPDGGQYTLEDKDFIESSENPDSDIFSDGKLLSAPYPRVTAGSVIEEEVITVSRPLVTNGGVMGSWSFGRRDSVALNRLVIDAPGSVNIQYLTGGFDLKPKEESNGGRKKLTWEVRNQARYDFSENGIPGSTYVSPRVLFSSAPDWQSLGRQYASLVEPIVTTTKIAVPAELKIDGSDPRKASIVLMRWLNSKIRYTGMELGVNSIVPVSPETVFDRGYGDCKDKAVIIVSLLRKLGVDASVALLWNGTGRDVEPSVSGMDSFNHAIVWVNAGGQPFFIDPTVDYNYTGDLPYSDQYRYALIARKDSPGLIRTPQLGTDKTKNLEIREVTFADIGNGDVRETTVYQGTMDSYYRNYYANRKITTTQDEFADYSRRHYDSEMTEFSFQKPDDYSQPYTLSFLAKGSKKVWTGDEEAQYDFPTTVLWDFVPKPFLDENAKARKYPYRFNIPINVEARSIIQLPAGFVFRQKDAPITRTAGIFSFSRTFERDDKGRLAVIVKLWSNQIELSAQQFDASRKAIIALKKEFDDLEIDFELQSKSLIAQGKYREAFDTYKQIIAANPNKYIHHVRLSRALLDGGLGDPAAIEAKRATELAPAESDTWDNLGWILQFDGFAKRFGYGYDRDGAIAAYKKSLELDPKTWYTHANLAILYEHDRNGSRYTDKTGLEKAIAEYRAIDDLVERKFDDNLWYALFYAGKTDEAGEMAPTLSETASRNIATLLQAILKDGVEAAMAGASLDMSQQELASAASAAIDVLFATRRYPETAALLRIAARGNKDSLSMENRADNLDKLKALPDPKTPYNDPAALMSAYFSAMKSFDGNNYENFTGLLDETALAFSKKISNPESLFSSWANLANTSRNGGLSLGNLSDFVASYNKIQVKGDDKEGWTVIAGNDITESRSVIFVLPRADKQVRISAFGSQFWLVGQGIRDGMKNGYYERALPWLGYMVADDKDKLTDIFVDFGKNPESNPILNFYWPRAKQNAYYSGIVAAALQTANPQSEKDFAELGDFFRKYWGNATEASANDLGITRNQLTAALKLSARFMADGYILLKQAEKGIPALKAVYESDPKNETIVSEYSYLLEKAGKVEEAKAVLDAALKQNPASTALQFSMFRVYMEQVDVTGLEAFVQASNYKMDATAYNNIAWLDLFGDSPSQKAIDYARKSVTMTQSKTSYNLHTLATLYARNGRLEDARSFLDAAIATSRNAIADGNDWIVLGLIAQGYGFDEAAKTAYQRVLADQTTEDDKTSTKALATKYLAQLAK